MSVPTDISVLIVNWRSGAMTRALIENLRGQRFTGGHGGQGSLDFVVVDNASGPEEALHLLALEAEPDVTLVRSAQNGGYATGMNIAAEHARGRYLLVTNPDVMAFRGALSAMLEHLRSHDGCGLAGPRGYLDPGRFFQLPPVDLPSLWELKSEAWARMSRWWGRRHAEARSRRALDQWTATAAGPRSMISGFCFMLDADLARELGPFDPGYPFYFEDSDLCLRLQRRGFTTDFVPRAEMVHFFNRSAGQAADMAMSRYGVSRARFFSRRYGWLGTWAYKGYQLFAGASGQGHGFAEVKALGECATVPEIDVPGSGSYLAEISADPGFVFAAGRLDITRRFRIPDDAWAGLVPATYYVRFLKRSSLEVLGTVSLTKTTPSAPASATAAADLVHA